MVVVQLPEAEQPAVWAYGIAPLPGAGRARRVRPRERALLGRGRAGPPPRRRARDAPATTARRRAASPSTSDATGHALERARRSRAPSSARRRSGRRRSTPRFRADLTELVAKVGGAAGAARPSGTACWREPEPRARRRRRSDYYERPARDACWPSGRPPQQAAERARAGAGQTRCCMSSDARRTGAEILWEILAREGVEVVFGYPGGAIMPAYDAMLEYPIRHVLVRHEQGAAHMADGYARASGKRRRRDRHVRPGRDEPRHGHRHGDARLDPHGLRHRAGRLASSSAATPSRRPTSPASRCPSRSTTTS